MKCCICGKEIERYGNNPRGALNQNGCEMEWGVDDECCDECNSKYVITGRIAKMYQIPPNQIIKIMPNNLVKR